MKSVLTKVSNLNKKVPAIKLPGLRNSASTYSPTPKGSTIGTPELNFSVRNGKRWILRVKNAF